MGDVTILIQNAGVAGYGTILEQKAQIIERVIQVNLLAHFWMLRAFLPKMIEQNRGHVLTISSLASFGSQ